MKTKIEFGLEMKPVLEKAIQQFTKFTHISTRGDVEVSEENNKAYITFHNTDERYIFEIGYYYGLEARKFEDEFNLQLAKDKLDRETNFMLGE